MCIPKCRLPILPPYWVGERSVTVYWLFCRHTLSTLHCHDVREAESTWSFSKCIWWLIYPHSLPTNPMEAIGECGQRQCVVSSMMHCPQWGQAWLGWYREVNCFFDYPMVNSHRVCSVFRCRYTENRALSWGQLCIRMWHRRLSLW